MSAITIDTHAFIKRLIAAGMPEQQAEAVTALVREARDTDASHLATKADLAETKADILKTIIGAIAMNAAVVIGAMFGLAKLLGH